MPALFMFKHKSKDGIEDYLQVNMHISYEICSHSVGRRVLNPYSKERRQEAYEVHDL